MDKKLLINVSEGEEIRIALLENGLVEELYVERAGRAGHVGDIYKGVVTNVEPSIQAAFIEFGYARNGFLHVSDVIPSAYHKSYQGKRKRGQTLPSINKVLKRGQEVVVQITREEIGTKGPSVTTYLSLPGRFLVLMPGIHRRGVSRKIADQQRRDALRKIMEELKLPEDLGCIVRTAGVDQTKRDLQRDLSYLLRLWKTLSNRMEREKAPKLIYQESDLVIRCVRDLFATDIDTILVDSEASARKIRDFLKIIQPRAVKRVKTYTDREPLFHRYGVEEEIERVFQRRVPLEGGGSVVIDPTEALVAIDVNSGTYKKERDPEKAALKVNLTAAAEVARQLRLRDLGGVVVIDFIDLGEEKNRRQVEKVLADAVKRDRARTRILRTSRFGLIEMTRQRMRSGLLSSHYQDCPYCKGTGQIKTSESMCLRILRLIRHALNRSDVVKVDVYANPVVGSDLQNRMRRALLKLEETTHKEILIHGDEDLGDEDVQFALSDANGNRLTSKDLPIRPAA